MFKNNFPNLETKFHVFDAETGLKGDVEIQGYASLFGASDKGGDVVQKGAYSKSLNKLKASGRSIKMLWQHDPSQPIGVWEQVFEDDKGLVVRGHILPEIQAGREALALIKAGAIDGLSIGYRTISAENTKTGGRSLHELELWEVSLVTFPMLPQARVEASGEPDTSLAHDLVDAISSARSELLA